MVWTSEKVAEAIKCAVEVSKRLPRVAPKGYKVSWVDICYERYEIYFMDKKVYRKHPLTKFEIALLDNVLEWVQILPTEEEKKIIWLKASLIPWKIICKRIGKSRQTLWTTWRNSLDYIAKNLNDSTKEWYNRNYRILQNFEFTQ